MKLSEEKINEIRNLYKEGVKLQDIANTAKVGLSTVKVYIKDLTGNRRPPLDLDKKRKNSVISVSKRRRKLKEMSIEYKGGKCEKCGYDKCNAALDFHHLDPTQKDFTISNGGYSKSWDKIKAELDKCIIVCANCHRELHDEINLGE